MSLFVDNIIFEDKATDNDFVQIENDIINIIDEEPLDFNHKIC